jgi:hypothetical protein
MSSEEINFKVFMAMKMWVVVFLVVMLCGLQDGYQCFEGMMATTYKTTWHHSPEDNNPYMKMFFTLMCTCTYAPIHTWACVRTHTHTQSKKFI